MDRRPLLLILWLCVASAGCERPRHTVTLVFPSQALMQASSEVEVEVFRQASSIDPCPKLKFEEPLGEELTNVFSQTVAFPFGPDDIVLKDLEDGIYVFVASAKNKSEKKERFLRGCTTESIGGDSKQIRIDLEEFRGCCRASSAHCLNATEIICYDGPPSTKGVGVCMGGLSHCENDYFTSCQGQVLPTEELCNGQDDDCDGAVDNVAPAKLADDPKNCGACGKTCKQTCTSGVCDEVVDGGPPVHDLGRDAGVDGPGPDSGLDGAPADGVLQPCTSSAQCTNPYQPICDKGLCQPCVQHVRCSDKDPQYPYCHTDGRCVACLTDASCQGAKKHCVSNDCVECRYPGQATDCPQSPKPMLCTLLHQCTEKCTKDGDCPTARPHCVGQLCVECATSTDCPSTSPICGFGGVCEQCTQDAQCPGHSSSLPYCSTGSCVACKQSLHCKNPSPICSATKTCVDCTTDAQCTTRDPAQPHCQKSGTKGCFECVNGNHCQNLAKPSCVYDYQAKVYACGPCFDIMGPPMDDCAMYHPSHPVCDYNTGACVECMTSKYDCTKDPQKPICENKVCRACKSAAECVALDAKTPVCDAGGACLGCKSNSDCTDPKKPVCNSDGSCRGCQSHSECSFLCDTVSGACIAESDAIFADSSAACPGSGTKAAPYCKLDTAAGNLTKQGQYLIATGTFSLTGALTFNNYGPHLRPAKGSSTPVTIRGAVCPLIVVNGVPAVFEQVVVQNSTGQPGGTGGGIEVAAGGALELRQSTVGPGSCLGVKVNGSLVMDRTLVHHNTGGGLQVVPQMNQSKITNCFIVQNGSTSSIVGGADLSFGGPMGGWVDFSFNTVANNTAKTGVVGGVIGDSFMMGPSGQYCIVWGNSEHQVSQYSEWYTSDIDDDQSWYNGYANIRLDPKFVGGGDFHLTVNSPCINKGPSSPSIKVDFDGDTRPQGPSSDMGADEYK